jgi:transposase
MSKKRVRRAFDAAFKQEAVRRMQEQQARRVPLSVIARALDVRPDQLRQWARALEAQPGGPLHDVFPGEGRLPTAEEEVRRLRRELEVVTMERDFLKKASAYFARTVR